ncbi:hypothetical protein [Brevibacillus brevis]|uniref:hypothetical protein n=1 Tax=Brevibacillus brevis TaxID=1393 RepID=UPI000D111627|nr:hypothetical protein [Brevibacillus brevis]PSJ69919.1 hypothetical protein C7J99_07805 [Brevibacillus brevis]RED21527.1 hypothetical protein DES34_120110 [Brevibacillus brevis]GEC93820.1 hypothetical protein BBR01nite_61510 [Brevibacillus brevis]VEF87399.1 Uncharacterised protein [Brevibacillus brevis]
MEMIGSSVLLGLNFQISAPHLDSITESEAEKIKSDFDFEEVKLLRDGIQFEKGFPFVSATFTKNTVVIYLVYGSINTNLVNLLKAMNLFTDECKLILNKLEIINTLNVKDPLPELFEESYIDYLKTPVSTEIKTEYIINDTNVLFIARFSDNKNLSIVSVEKNVQITDEEKLSDIIDEYRDIATKTNLDFFMAWPKTRNQLKRT